MEDNRIMSDFQDFLDENLDSVHIDVNDRDVFQIEEYDIFDEISKDIWRIRRENKLTQKELANRSGLTQAKISNFEKGGSKPTIDSLKKIADATNRRLVVRFAEQEVE